jgi:hypothetical protein
MMPLCTSAISPRENIGCAFWVSGAPCVAQRVCAIPVSAAICCCATWPARSATRATLRRRSSPPSTSVATPHES